MDITPTRTETDRPKMDISSAKDWQSLSPREPEVELKGYEAQFAADNPNIYAASRVFADFVPFLRFAYPSEREEFGRLETHEQVGSLLLDAAFLALMTPWGKGLVGAALKAPARLIARPKNIKPITELVREARTGFDHTTEALKVLRKSTKMTKAEAVAVAEGEIGQLTGTFSKGLTEALHWEGWRPRLSPKIAAELDPIKLEQNYLRSEYKRLAKQTTSDLFGGTKDMAPEFISNLFEARGAKLFGEAADKITLENAGALHMRNLIDDMVRHPRQIRRLANLGGENLFFNSFAPIRVVMGATEKVFGTNSKIYNPLMLANGFKNKYAARATQGLWEDLQHRGLGKIITSKASGSMEFVPAMSKEEFTLVGNLLGKFDDMIGKLRGSKIPGAVKKGQEQIVKEIEGSSEKVRQMVWAYYDHVDGLYADHMIKKIPRIFAKKEYGLTPAGRRGVAGLMRDIRPKILKNFGTEDLSVARFSTRAVGVQRILAEVRQTLKHPMVAMKGQHPWFKGSGEKLIERLGLLEKDLTTKNGRFVQYLENYTARIGQRNAKKFSSWSRVLVPKDLQPGFAKARQMLESGVDRTDLSSIIESRINAQANDLYLYPAISKIVRNIGTMPKDIKLYTHHWISRGLNKTSAMDVRVAQWLSNSVGALEEKLGLSSRGVWTDRRVRQLAQTVNNLTHMGGLGFKPFSAIRNLFQPLITVPADLGGLRDIVHLGQGALRALNPATRKTLRGMGIIGEYAPELGLHARAIPFGPKIGSVQLPALDKVRDTAMWLFRGSDRWNRYVTGGAALNKWEAALARVGEKRLLKGEGIEEFVRRSGIAKRYPWKREQLTDLLRRGNLEGAKSGFIRDVVADTQFLYTGMEQPIAYQKWGALGKTGFIFQSWWMNYGQLLAKWAQTGETIGGSAGRLITAMTSQAIAFELINQLFGSSRALKALGTGPFPSELNEYMIPPSWTPVYHSLRTIMALGALPLEQDTEKVRKRAKAILDSTWMFVPGGLQIKGLVKEGWEGLPESMLQLKKPTFLGPVGKGVQAAPDALGSIADLMRRR